jgi:hypothetical protein
VTTLETYPLIQTLLARTKTYEDMYRGLNDELLRCRNEELPAAVTRKVEAERMKSKSTVKIYKSELDLIKRELEREQVQRRASRKEMAEREAMAEERMVELKK